MERQIRRGVVTAEQPRMWREGDIKMMQEDQRLKPERCVCVCVCVCRAVWDIKYSRYACMMEWRAEDIALTLIICIPLQCPRIRTRERWWRQDEEVRVELKLLLTASSSAASASRASFKPIQATIRRLFLAEWVSSGSIITRRGRQ